MENEIKKQKYDIMCIYEQIFEILEYDPVFLEIKDKLIQYRKYGGFQYELIGKMETFFKENEKDIFSNDIIDNEGFLLFLQELINDGRLEFEYKLIPKLKLPLINTSSKPGHNSLYYEDEDEKHLRESVENLGLTNIIWKSCQEIFPNEDLVILPEKLDCSCFNQGYIGDCYFITCIQALSKIPQLLNFILGLSTGDQKNQIASNQEDFKVKFFIDGEWEIISIKNNFPIIKKKGKKDELLGVVPNKNELFLMILEKAWAKINVGYDKIKGGYNDNIFELFLGCKCDCYQNIKNDDVFINSLYERIKLNEKFCGQLTLCGSNYYNIETNFSSEMKQNKYIFDKKECLRKGKIKFSSGHAYNILKTKEIIVKPYNDGKKNYYAFNKVKFLIISNPHGKESELIGSGIELKKISEILNKKFGEKNRAQYKDILDINKKYEDDEGKGTGIIYMPLDYFKEWSEDVSVCYAHYDCLNYTLDINNELECLYIYKIRSKNRQYFTCQICFPSYRAHYKECDELYILFEIDGNKIYEVKKPLFYSTCGIKIINSENFSNVEKPYFSDDLDFSSIKEIKTVLENGEYIIMIYMESTFNKCVLRFLSEDEIKINLINKIPKGRNNKTFAFNSLDDIQKLFNNYDYITYYNLINKNKKKIISYDIKPKDFLFGIRQHYLYLKELSKKLNIKPEDAIYSISQDGNAYNYSIIDPNTMIKMFGKKKEGNNEISDIIPLNTILFRDNLGNPYKVNNIDELMQEIKNNKNPFSCLLSGYDENFKIMKNEIVHLKIIHNKIKNEDILVITDESGNYIRREQKPLMIIILDTSKSLEDYHENLQNKIIPKLLEKLGYTGIKNKVPELYELLKEIKITMFELLMLWSSRYRREKFIKKHKSKKVFSDEKIKEIEKALQDVIILITFSDDSELFFYDKSEFDDCELKKGLNTYFCTAAKNLNDILNSISRERSIRLLCFSDGEIYDAKESNKILDEILNSTKNRHQIKSLSIRVCHEKANPDTKLLMKLSNFSYPMSGMEQVDIDPNKIDEVVEQLSDILEKDDMEYNLRLYSSEIMMSSDFSDKFTYEQYYNKRNRIFRICGGHKPINYYKDLINKGKLKVSTGQKIEIENGDELNEKSFNKIIKQFFPKLAQKNLEEKLNKNKDKVNQSIKNYLKETEKGLKYKPSDFLETMDKNEEINKMKPKEISELIKQVKEEAKEIIYKNEAEFLKEEKNNLKNKINELCPTFYKKMISNNKKYKKKKHINIKDDSNFNKKINYTFEEIETEIDSKDKVNVSSDKKEKQNISKIKIINDNNKDKYENIIFDKSIIIEKEKEKIKSGYHQIISPKSIYDNDSYEKKSESTPDSDEFQKKIIECIKKRENILFASHENTDRTKIAKSVMRLAKTENIKIIYACSKISLSKRNYYKLKGIIDIGIITDDVRKNNKASCIVTTMEFLRNMFFLKKNDLLIKLLNQVNLVIFDELYHINNSKIFTILEEIIIFFKDEVNFLFISSPFPNMEDFGIWMAKLKKKKFNILYSSLRSINLRHYILTDNINDNKEQSNLVLILESRLVTDKNIEQKNTEEIFYDERLNQAFAQLEHNEITNKKNMINIKDKNLIDLIKKLYLDKFCPAIIFCNSIDECEKNARDLFQYIHDCNKSKDKKLAKKGLKKKRIDKKIEFNNTQLKEEIKNEYNKYLKLEKQTDDFSNYLLEGIGYYHNEMFSFQKELLEILFQKGYIKILFATENFDLPSKTIILTNIFKPKENRFLTGSEYYQISERIAKNGKEKFGNIIIMLNKNIKKEEYLSIIKGRPDPLKSRFKLSLNLVANLIRINYKIEDLLSKTFYQFQIEKDLMILQNILAKLFNEYLKNDFNDEVREVKIKEIFEIKNKLTDLKKQLFISENFEQYLSFGRIIKIKYFGYGILINKEKKLYNEKNSYIITEHKLNKIKKYSDNYTNFDSDNFNNNNHEEIIINNKYVKNDICFENIISENLQSSNDNNDKNDEIDEISETSQDNDNKEYILDVLVSLKSYPDSKDILSPGDFEFNSFYGIIPFSISMVEEIYDIIIDINSKENNKTENLGKDLKEKKKKVNDKFPILDIINEYKKANNINNINALRDYIKDQDKFDLLIEISETEREYNQLKASYIKKNIIPVNNNKIINYDLENKIINDNGVEFEQDIEKYEENEKLIKKIEKILTKIKLQNNLGLVAQLPKIQEIKDCLYKIDFITKDNKGEHLTIKGDLMCDIPYENNFILSELFLSNDYGILTIEKIGLIICCCLKKKIREKKEIKDNNSIYEQNEINNVLEKSINKVKNIAAVLFKKEEDRIKFINIFNGDYMRPVYSWIKSNKNKNKFKQLIEDNKDLYSEISLINIFTKIEKIARNFEKSNCLNNILQDKFRILGKKIIRGLPVKPNIYLE